MDVVGPVVPSMYGEQYILVMQDQLTKWMELAPMKKADTDSILDKFMRVWVCRFGAPENLLTDRASTFIGAVSQAFCKAFGIEKINTTAYRPQGNGSNERTHQELIKYLSIFLEGQQKSKWRWLLGDAQMAHNTAYHTGLRSTPYEVLFGEPPPFGPLGIPEKQDEVVDFETYYGLRRAQLMEKRRKAYENLKAAQDAMIGYRNRYAHEIKFKIGDRVWYKIHVRKTKFDPRYAGPYKVVAIISPVVYVLEGNGKRFLGHAAYMKPCRTSDLSTTGNTEILPDEESESEKMNNDDQGLMGISLEGEIMVRSPQRPIVFNPNVARIPPQRPYSAPRENTNRRELRVQLEDINAQSTGRERYSRHDTPRLRDMLSSPSQSGRWRPGSSRGAQASEHHSPDVVSPSRISEQESAQGGEDERYPRRETWPPFWQTTRKFIMGNSRARSANYRSKSSKGPRNK
jgi:hypothetical protein